MKQERYDLNRYGMWFYRSYIFAGILGVACSGNFLENNIEGYIHAPLLKYGLILVMTTTFMLGFSEKIKGRYNVIVSAMIQFLLATILYSAWINRFPIILSFLLIITIIVVIPFQFSRKAVLGTFFLWVPLSVAAYLLTREPQMEAFVFLFSIIALPSLTLVVSLEKIKNAIKMERMAYYDNLTGVPTREHTRQLLEEKILQGKPFGFLFVDLDDFKSVNDLFGHNIGDEVLRQTAKSLQRSMRKDDIVGRFSGDEFLVLLNSCRNRSDVEHAFNRIRDAFDVRVKNRIVTFSVGAIMFPEDAGDYMELLRKADIAMYKSKAKGKNQLSFYDNQYDFYLYMKNLDA